MSEFKAKTEHINYALLVDPEMTYPVSYYILPNGAKQLCPTVAKGKDLTENQIKELIEKKIVHVGYVPISIYTTTSAELDYYKNRVEAAEKGRTDSTNAHVQTIAELETVKAELDRGKWISVSDKLPDGEVIATNGFEMIIGYVSRQEDLFIAAYEDLELPNVTHWQPLPTPPHKN